LKPKHLLILIFLQKVPGFAKPFRDTGRAAVTAYCGEGLIWSIRPSWRKLGCAQAAKKIALAPAFDSSYGELYERSTD
jgi:hypothetical protein